MLRISDGSYALNNPLIGVLIHCVPAAYKPAERGLEASRFPPLPIARPRIFGGHFSMGGLLKHRDCFL